MTSRTAFRFQRRVLERERPLLVGVTFNAGCVRSGSQSGLFQFKSTVRVVAVTALHRAFQDLVMERSAERRLHFVVATHAELRLPGFQHVER